MVETAWALKEHLKSYGIATPKIIICERPDTFLWQHACSAC